MSRNNLHQDLREVHLSGELAERYGPIHHYAIKTPAEAIRALSANYKDFAGFMMDSEKRNVGYRIVVGEAPIADPKEMRYPSGNAIIHIAPVIGGAKSGLGQVFIGAALIGASFFLSGAPLIAGLGALSPSLASISFGLGFSLALGGVSQMLSPQPKSQSPSERPENKPSHVFDGGVNTTAQGQPVPIGYGRLIIGSAVISAGISAEDII